jgi:hypothetical protein
VIEVLRLRRDTEVGVEWPIGLTIPEEVDGERGSVRERELGCYVPPEKAAGAEAVHE